MNNDFTNKNWELYLTRPFSLFGASLWNQWYFSNTYFDILGVRLNNCLMIEYVLGIVKYYRDSEEVKQLNEAFHNLAVNDESKLKALFERGLNLNQQALDNIENNHFTDFNEAVDFLVELSLLCTVLPFKVGEAYMEKVGGQEIAELITQLRAVSYYERVIEVIVRPLAMKKLNMTMEEIDLLTLQEVYNNAKVDINERKVQRENGALFIYKNHDGKEDLSWTKNTLKVIKSIDGESQKAGVLKGNIAYKGKVRGRVRVVLDNSVRTDFKKGDILVAISTSPELMTLITKCGAIVTDEGGITCHAAIISREYKIPCIIGTKFATQEFKDGDLVEVDAYQGIVTKIK
jgi:phosphohistidine swiveling domain-containing protein